MVCEDAILFGYRLAFNGYSRSRQGGIANLASARGKTVHGVVWEVPNHEVEALDHREGAPHFYERVPVRVRMNGEWVEAETYRLVHPESREIAPAPAYARLILGRVSSTRTIANESKSIISRVEKGADTTCQMM